MCVYVDKNLHVNIIKQFSLKSTILFIKQSNLHETGNILRIGSSSNGSLELNNWVSASVEWLSKTTQVSGRGGKPAEDRHINTGGTNVAQTHIRPESHKHR